jgi:hypothetical protein
MTVTATCTVIPDVLVADLELHRIYRCPLSNAGSTRDGMR